jgi:hypothetical protein
MKSRHLQKIAPCDVAGLFIKAYSRAALLHKAISGFRSPRIIQMNPDIFTDEDFIVQNHPSAESATSYDSPSSISL